MKQSLRIINAVLAGAIIWEGIFLAATGMPSGWSLIIMGVAVALYARFG